MTPQRTKRGASEVRRNLLAHLCFALVFSCSTSQWGWPVRVLENLLTFPSLVLICSGCFVPSLLLSVGLLVDDAICFCGAPATRRVAARGQTEACNPQIRMSSSTSTSLPSVLSRCVARLLSKARGVRFATEFLGRLTVLALFLRGPMPSAGRPSGVFDRCWRLPGRAV